MVVGTKRASWFVAVTEPAQVGRDETKAIGEAGHHGLPGEPELRPAVQQKQRAPLARLRHVKAGAICLNHEVLNQSLILSQVRSRELSVTRVPGPLLECNYNVLLG